MTRKIISLYLLQASVIILTAGLDIYPKYDTKGMLGFAQMGNTTGGIGGKVIHIHTLEDLKKNVGGKESSILVINENIGTSKLTILELGCNKSIIGSWNAHVLSNVNFKSSHESRNIIIQNLVFQHDTKDHDSLDTQISITCGERYWIDHCTFEGGKIDLKDEGKMIRVNGKVDYVTISNCKFTNRRFGLILGQVPENDKEVKEYDNYPRVSVMFNYYCNIRGRAPALARLGYFHFLNNYIKDFHLGFTLHLKAKIYSEQNYFSKLHGGTEFNEDDGTSQFTDNKSVNLIEKPKSGSTSWHPSSDYKYTSMTADQAKEFCSKNSGAQDKSLVFGGIPD